MGWSDADLTTAMAVVFAIILAGALVRTRVRPGDLAGFWASQKTGEMYEIRPSGPRGLTVYQGGRPRTSGRIWGGRLIRTESNQWGLVEPGRRLITWTKGGGTWAVQGLRAL